MRNRGRGNFAAMLACGAALACLAPAPAVAEEAARAFDIPAQDLGSALRQFGKVTGRQIIFSEELVRGHRSVAVRGRHEADEALRRLLAGSGLRIGKTSGGMYVLEGRGGAAAPDVAGETLVADPDIVVTGSRIRKAGTGTSAPLTALGAEELSDRGYVQVGELLNDVTSNVPTFPINPTKGYPAGSGQTYPNLFNLGAGRTLTLVNGRRMVASASGLGDRVVDTNVIPAGLIKRVEIIQGGGAAVYGSDAIAGVVNYILKDDFEGIELDLQNSISTRGDDWRPYGRLTAGSNFAGGRGNIAVNLEYSKTDPLLDYDRPWTDLSPTLVTNPDDTGPADGEPTQIYITHPTYRFYNRNGVLYRPSGAPPFFAGFLTQNGQSFQFSPDGKRVIPYDQGIYYGGSASAIGGDGHDWRESSTMASGVERYTASANGHFDISDNVRLIGEFVYGHQKGTDPYGTQAIFRTMFNGYDGGGGLIRFDRTNPYLTPEAIDVLDTISPDFAAGNQIFLSRFMDILPSRNRGSERDSWRALVGLEGEFAAGDRSFYWSLTGSRGETSGFVEVWAPHAKHLNNALDTVLSGGQIMCRINADADPANDDPACAPINPFGDVKASPEAVAYATVLSGSRFKNVQDDYLATFGGDLLKLPAGLAKFSIAYEHRREFARYTPYEADQLGLPYNCCATLPSKASYNTDEFSAELLLPLVGGDFTLPGIRSLTADGSFRFVDNSIAGKEKVWGAGLRWDTGFGLTFRGSRSRNFRAPTLDQIFAPQSVSNGPIGRDPCDVDSIDLGPNPAVRRANCEALFAANPGYGPLGSFQDPAENTSLTQITTGGNLNLKNEISDTWTYGVVVEPDFIPGLSFTADRIEVRLKDGLTAFSPANFLAVCFDSTDFPADACSNFARNDQGYVVTANQTTFNAAVVKYHGEIYNLNYRLPLERLFAKDWGTLEFNVEATHTTLALSNATGFSEARTEGTVTDPDWRGRFDLRYTKGPFRFFYQLYYLPKVKNTATSTVENDPTPWIAANYRHSISVQYELDRMTLRAGVNNLTDEGPSFPTRAYGDIYGRQFYIGAKMRFR
ncbi:TonB-dependent receptor [Sphingopyxis sp.]|uniref:TonB-dependent receptor n=1 Tax=Sphingopyxis sp. TaxID=1908224 RepID=UPI002EDABB9C